MSIVCLGEAIFTRSFGYLEALPSYMWMGEGVTPRIRPIHMYVFHAHWVLPSPSTKINKWAGLEVVVKCFFEAYILILFVFEGVLMVLSGAAEFSKLYNKDIVERESDDRELPLLIKQLSNMGADKKEFPFCVPYSVKARALIFAYLNHTPLPSDALQSGSVFCHYHINVRLQCIME